ncbi:MAG: UDP-N-acetylmuramoyl-L-alanyl-D-glutamate--2,6-diaminopimelate ligase [Acidimicrobiia bacterium]
MRLDEIVAGAHDLGVGQTRRVGPAAEPSPEVTAVEHDTARVVAGTLFCCVPGARVDGHDLAADAVRAGAVALLVERELPVGAAQVEVPSVRDAMGPVAAAFWSRPSEDLTVAGVTGTSGKTTSTHLLAAVLRADGRPTEVLGTLSGARTTPEAPELQARLAAARDAGVRAVAMEVSSHALAMGRVRGTRFAVGIFTNLSRDHLDFHRDLDDYFAAKASLFDPAYLDAGVADLDDPRGAELVARATVPMTGYSRAEAVDLQVGPQRSTFRWRGHHVELPLGGAFNVSNALAAATAATVLGIDEEVVVAGLGAVAPVPGRWEPVEEGQPFSVVVDYSHKPDALANALRSARDVVGPGGRVVVVFGAGGERDAAKRPEMGEVASRLADHVVLTSDNPRGEVPLAIIAAIRAGATGPAELDVEPDRAVAIGRAVAGAGPGDVVLVAGKGHETTQVFAGRTVAFDDREVARAALRARREVAGW